MVLPMIFNKLAIIIINRQVNKLERSHIIIFSLSNYECMKTCRISGLVLGAIIRYGSPEPKKPSVVVDLPPNSSYDASNLPDSLRLEVFAGPNNTNPNYHQYNYDKRIDEDAVSDVELEEKVLSSKSAELKHKIKMHRRIAGYGNFKYSKNILLICRLRLILKYFSMFCCHPSYFMPATV